MHIYTVELVRSCRRIDKGHVVKEAIALGRLSVTWEKKKPTVEQGRMKMKSEGCLNAWTVQSHLFLERQSLDKTFQNRLLRSDCWLVHPELKTLSCLDVCCRKTEAHCYKEPSGVVFWINKLHTMLHAMRKNHSSRFSYLCFDIAMYSSCNMALCY